MLVFRRAMIRSAAKAEMICQLNWKTLPGLRGLACSEFRAAETAARRTTSAESRSSFSDEAERDALLRELETLFCGAAIFE